MIVWLFDDRCPTRDVKPPESAVESERAPVADEGWERRNDALSLNSEGRGVMAGASLS